MASIHYENFNESKNIVSLCCLPTVLDLPCIGVGTRGAKGTHSPLENEM